MAEWALTMAMSQTLHAALVVLLVLASSAWLGGYVAIAVVATAARTALDAESRVAFFRALGRSYLRVGGTALVVASVSGGVLLSRREWDGLAVAAVVLAVALVALLAVAVAQARRMTRLRQTALAALGDDALNRRVRDGGRAAGALRGLLGLLSLALLVIGCLLAL